MGDSETAKDALQESLIQVINKMDRYQEQGRFKAWVSSVTVKKCLDLLRKEKRHKYYSYEDSPEPYVEEQSSLALEQKDVMKFMETIPDRYRLCINMFLVEGFSHKEIAEQLDISVSSSRSLVSRGRKMIMDAFSAEKEMMENYYQSPKPKTESNPRLKIV